MRVRDWCERHGKCLPVPALRQRRIKTGRMKLVGRLVCTEKGDVALAKRQVDLGEFVQRGELAGIRLSKPDMGHGSGDRLRFVLPSKAVVTLFHGSYSWSLLRAASSCTSSSREGKMWKSSPLTPAVYDTRCVGRANVGVPCCSLLFKHTNSHSGMYRSAPSLRYVPSARKHLMRVLASSISGKPKVRQSRTIDV